MSKELKEKKKMFHSFQRGGRLINKSISLEGGMVDL
jgi:hypothetical protein